MTVQGNICFAKARFYASDIFSLIHKNGQIPDMQDKRYPDAWFLEEHLNKSSIQHKWY